MLALAAQRAVEHRARVAANRLGVAHWQRFPRSAAAMAALVGATPSNGYLFDGRSFGVDMVGANNLSISGSPDTPIWHPFDLPVGGVRSHDGSVDMVKAASNTVFDDSGASFGFLAIVRYIRPSTDARQIVSKRSGAIFYQLLTRTTGPGLTWQISDGTNSATTTLITRNLTRVGQHGRQPLWIGWDQTATQIELITLNSTTVADASSVGSVANAGTFSLGSGSGVSAPVEFQCLYRFLGVAAEGWTQARLARFWRGWAQ